MREDLIDERKKKLALIKEQGRNPYPARVVSDAPIAVTLNNFDDTAANGSTVSLVGRVRGMRGQGGVVFLDIRDNSGQIQAVLKKDTTNGFDFLKNALDIGDFMECSGTFFTTQKGEKSIAVVQGRIIAKSLRPLPSEWYGFENTEKRFRERYVDLLMHEETKELFRKKFLFWRETRIFLEKAGFEEVELPILEPLAGGADAEPFRTHHNALDTDFYLRISLELPLKKLVVGGFEKVFEIGRVFRNEGIDAEHLQDYTACEFYWAYADYTVLMKFVEKLFKTVIKKTFGSLELKNSDQIIDWGKKWPTLDYFTLFKKFVGLDLMTATRDDLYKKALIDGLSPEVELGRGRLIDLLFKKFVRPTLVAPAFLIDPPVDIEPLAKRKEGHPERVERFQIVGLGSELGKGFSELNDPEDQRVRFEEQMRLRAAGDKEAQTLDEDYIRALEYGCPPTAGFGFSERLFAVLAEKPVRELVFFPLMKPKEPEK